MSGVSDSEKTARRQPAAGLVGRERELERLGTALQAVLDGTGRLVLLAGEHGIGKTRLAEELARRARERGTRVAWGRCWTEEGAPDLWPWRQVIRTCIRSVDEEVLRELVGPRGSELTTLVAPPREAADAPPPSESPAARFRLFNAIAHFLDAYAERIPLVVILDDLHRADPSSLLLLQFFTHEQRQRRILLIGTYREPGTTPNRTLTQAVIEAAREPGTERLTLGALSAAESAALLHSLFEVEPDAETVRVLHARTGGNPLFLTECARRMGGRGETGEDHATPSALDLPIPAELREVIEQRLAPLSADDREVLRLAALLGREFRRDSLDRLVAGSPATEGGDPAAAALGSAEKLGLVLRGASAGSHRFAQGMVRELLADEVPAAQRAELRRRLEAESNETGLPPPPAVPAPSAPETLLFRKEGDYWTLSFGGRTCRIRDIKGLAHVAMLLRYPGKPVHVTELVHLGGIPADGIEADAGHRDESTAVRVGLGDAGVVFDDRARCDYRGRLDDLRAELQEAIDFHDTGRAERAREEIDFLTRELSAAIGLGGRVRRVASHAERARINVTRSIARVLERLEEIHPELANHLRRTIRTGTFCTYVPDTSVKGAWGL